MVAGLEEALQPFLSATVRDLDAQLAPLPRAQAHLALAHAAGALLQLLLRARGVDPEHHAANKETVRRTAFFSAHCHHPSSSTAWMLHTYLSDAQGSSHRFATARPIPLRLLQSTAFELTSAAASALVPPPSQKRLAQFAKKVAKAAADKELRESRRSLEVDVVAMSRFIAAALPDLSAAQRLSLKSAKSGQAAKRTAGGGAGGASGGVRRPKSGAPHKDEAAAFLEETLAGGGGAPS